MSISFRKGKRKPYIVTFKRVYLDNGRPICKSFITEEEAKKFQNDLDIKYPAGCKVKVKERTQLEKCITRFEYIDGTVNFRVIFTRRYLDKEIIRRFNYFEDARLFKKEMQVKYPTKKRLGTDKRYLIQPKSKTVSETQVNGCIIKRTKEGRCELYLDNKCPYEKYNMCNTFAMNNRWPAFKRIGGIK